MKCPNCGHWNKASLPRCFKCGEPLRAQVGTSPQWREKFDKPQNKVKQRVVYDDTVQPVEDLVQEAEAPKKRVAKQIAHEDEQALAVEMSQLKDRRARGQKYLQDFRENAAEKGMAPTGTGVVRNAGNRYAQEPDDPSELLFSADDDFTTPDDETPAEKPYVGMPGPAQPIKRKKSAGDAGRDRYPQVPYEDPYALYDADIPPGFDTPGPIAPLGSIKKRRRKVRGPILLAYVLVGALVLTVLGFGVYAIASYIVPSLITSQSAEKIENVHIEPITVDGLPGHRILIPGEEGSQYYITEMNKPYVVVGGVATIEVADHTFYDMIEPLDANMETMSVQLSPTLYKNGTETRMEPITYVIEIPASPITLIRPEVPEISVNASLYTLQLNVTPNSRVTINREDVSDKIDASGNLSHNVPVQAKGNNEVMVTVRAPFCRETNLEILLYREPTEILLELDPTTFSRSSNDRLTIKGTTENSASIIMDSPYYSIDESSIDKDGTFSVDVKLTRVGDNVVKIRAIYPGKKDAVLEHTIYYLPPVDAYSRKAWAFGASDYTELLNNITLRVENAQIYECKGTIKQIISSNPQLLIMDTGTDGTERLIMLENSTVDKTFVVGQKWRVYADVSGVYNTMPRLVARYAYLEEDVPAPYEGEDELGGIFYEERPYMLAGGSFVSTLRARAGD